MPPQASGKSESGSDKDGTLLGLTAGEVKRLLAEHGANDLPGTRPRNLLRLVGEVLKEPMLLLLLAAAAIYVVLGERNEAIALSVSSCIVIAISVLQARRTEHSLAKLRELSSPRALVIRDGVEQRIAGRDVVPGDLVLLQEGDRVPADARLLSAEGLSIDESILTGESLPVDKTVATGAADESTSVHSGTLIVRGHGIARVYATGEQSQIGQIGKSLNAVEEEPTPLFREVRHVVRVCAVAGLVLCTVVAIVYGSKHADWLAGFLVGIALAMGLMPEEFPVVLTISLALGAYKLSREKVLTRRMPALETIGAVTVLGVDKTGTLTENRMSVVLLDTDTGTTDLRKSAPLLDSTREVLATSLAASELSAADRMEKAIHSAAQTMIPEAVAALSQSTLVREYDLTPELLAVTHAWQRPDRAALDVTVKGAPEAVFRLCRLSEVEQRARLVRVAALANEGLRVLAVARGTHDSPVLPDHPEGFELRLLGLVCFADPLRADVPAALAECHAAGIRVVMITGDHPGTASAIAREAGFTDTRRVVTGTELRSLSPDALEACVRDVSIYARMSPADKLTLVKAFKARGDIVAMTGDGVNDAPALKAAHVGVAMGGRGSDVAREAAAIVLLNDDFASLVRAVRSGRRIYDNLQHAMAFILAVHIPIAGMGLLPIVLGWPVLLLPLHIVFMEFVIDPACAFVFEADPPAQDIMRRKARAPGTRMFTPALLRRGLVLGTIVLGIVFTVYAVALAYVDDTEARALGFIALVAGNLALILVNRGPGASLRRLVARHNAIFWSIGAVSLLLLGCVIYIPTIAAAFRFSEPSLAAIVAVPIATIAAVVFGGLSLGGRLRRTG